MDFEKKYQKDPGMNRVKEGQLNPADVDSANNNWILGRRQIIDGKYIGANMKMVLTTMSPIANATEGAKPITVCSEIHGMRGTLQPKEENLSILGICFLRFVDILCRSSLWKNFLRVQTLGQGQ